MLIKLTLSTGNPVWVNPSRVCYAATAGNDPVRDGSILSFSGDPLGDLFVLESLEQILRMV